MHQPLRIEVPDERHAEALRSYLQPFDVETVVADGRCEVRVDLVEANPEQRVVNALDGIDTWLAAAGVSHVRVHLHGSSYTLHAAAATVA